MVRLMREEEENERNKEDESIIKGGGDGGREKGPKSPHSHNLVYCIVEGPVLRCFSLVVPNL